jgi:amino acid transporter
VWGAGWIVLLITLLNSSLACANGATIAASRTLLSMGQQRTLPAVVARTDARQSPIVAVSMIFGVGIILAFWLGEFYTPVTAFSMISTMVTIAILPIYFAAALSCPIYYFRYRRNEINWLLHVVVPILGVAVLVPAFFAGSGIKAFSFVGSLAYPSNLAGPIVAAWYAVGIVMAVYVFAIRPRRARIVDVSSDAGMASFVGVGTEAPADLA